MKLTVIHRLLSKLYELDKEAARELPRKGDQGLGGIGLILSPKLANGGYHCTPTNSCTFANTGGGVHFSFLGEVREISDASPVVVTIPSADNPNFIVGENLYDFLCFGMFRGFFALEQLGYRFEETFTAYTDPNWQPSESRHEWVGLSNDDRKQGLLRLLAKRFGLVPWRDPTTKFERLQQTYLRQLIVPDLDDYLADAITDARLKNRLRHIFFSILRLCGLAPLREKSTRETYFLSPPLPLTRTAFIFIICG